MKIVVIGKNGQVSRHLRQVLGTKAIYLDHTTLDLADINTVFPLLTASKADVIINAGAYTDTKQAEIQQGLAYAINGAAVGEIARAAKEINALLIHLSTDYVFDGEKTEAYSADDITNPISVYGSSKALGEQLITDISPKHLTIRTSWVFSQYRENFVKTIARLAFEKEHLDIIADQTGCPTYAGNLAKIIGEIVSRYGQRSADQNFTSGIYHYADSTPCSWYDFAKVIVKTLRESDQSPTVKTINPIKSSDWPSPIKRPINGVLACDKLLVDWGLKRFDWEASLPSVLNDINSISSEKQ